MKHFETIVFDFDGTIANTLLTLIEIYNTILAPVFNLRPIPESDTDQLRSQDPRELFSVHGVNFLKLPFIVVRARSELSNKINDIKPQDGIVSILEKLNKSGVHLGICTSNSKNNVTRFLSSNNMSNLFEFIYSGKQLFGKQKLLKKCIHEQHLRKETTLFVGDEIRDIEAARSVGLETIAVTWGFNNKEAFKKVLPDHLIDSPEQLLSFA